MASGVLELFDDPVMVARIRDRLPVVFQIAEVESSRAGKVGMQVGSLRERILVALLIYKFAERNVTTDVPVTESETDVRVYGEPVSIKTITGKGYTGVKLLWGADQIKAKTFLESYTPSCGILFARIVWGSAGGLFLIPKEVQLEVIDELGQSGYIKLPKPGTNNRGVEMTTAALKRLLEHRDTRVIDIAWNRRKGLRYNPYERWVDLWRRQEV